MTTDRDFRTSDEAVNKRVDQLVEEITGFKSGDPQAFSDFVRGVITALVMSARDKERALTSKYVDLTTSQETIAHVHLKPMDPDQQKAVSELPVSRVVIRNKNAGQPMSGFTTELTIDGNVIQSAHRVTFRVAAGEPSVMVLEMLAPDVTIETDTYVNEATIGRDAMGHAFDRAKVSKSG